MKSKSIKSIISKNNRITKAISIVMLVLIMFGLFAFILTGLYRFGLIEIPEFIQNIFFKTDGGDSEIGKDDRNIYDFLRSSPVKSGGEDNNGYVLEITRENIQDIISKTKLPDNIYLETEAHYYDGDIISITEEMSLWKKGGKYKYILTVNLQPEESYTNDSENELIENFRTDSKSVKAASPAFSFNNIPHISNINYYLNLLDNGEIENCSVYQNRDANIAHIKYSVPELNQWELIDVSLDTGIVLRVRCFTGEHNDLYYECETTVIEEYFDGDTQSEAATVILDGIFEIR